MSCRRPKMQIKPRLGMRSTPLRSTNNCDLNEDTSKLSSNELKPIESSNDDQNKVAIIENDIIVEKRTADQLNDKPIEPKRKRSNVNITVYYPDKSSESNEVTNNSNDDNNKSQNDSNLDITVKEKESLDKESENTSVNKSLEVSEKAINKSEPIITTIITQVLDEDCVELESNHKSIQSNNEIIMSAKVDDLKTKDEINNREQTSIPISNPSNEPNNQNVNNETIVTNDKNSHSDKQKESEIKSANISKLSKEINRKRKCAKTRSQTQTDKTKMTMKDLVLYNPPLTEEQKEQRKYDSESEKSGNEIPNITVKAVKKNEIQESTKASDNTGPRVKVGADGTLILDEESVIVKRKKNETNEPVVVETAKTTSACTNYSSFRTRATICHKPRWNEPETVRFYSALNLIGTDFTLMANLFFKGKRSRLDLRNKFKKEEKTNKLMIDEALSSPNSFINQCEELQGLLDETSSESNESEDESPAKKVSIKADNKAKAK